MTRWPRVALAAAIAVAAFACLGCEGPSDASAESGSNCAHMSERNDAQCAADLEGCSRDCLHGSDEGKVAAREAHGCSKSDCTCSHRDGEGCAEDHAAAGCARDHGGAKSDCTCPHDGCDHAHAAGAAENAAAHPGCPHARALDTERESEAH